MLVKYLNETDKYVISAEHGTVMCDCAFVGLHNGKFLFDPNDGIPHISLTEDEVVKNVAKCSNGKFKTEHRKFFIKGDIIMDETGTPYVWIKPYGADAAYVMTGAGEEITVKLPLYFYPCFDQGYIFTTENK